MQNLLYLIPLIPLFGFLITGILGAKMPKKIVGSIATLAVFIAFLLTVATFYTLKTLSPLEGTVLSQELYNWFSVGNFSVDFSFTVDPLSIVMMLIITGVGSLIHLYSMGYMAHDKGYHKFFAYLNLFIFSMLLLVMGSNLLILFIGWEGVGLCSFLLIGFWYSNKEYTYAARKAFIMNRIGDLGLLIGIFLLAYYVGSIQFEEINQIIQQFDKNNPILIGATICLFIGAMGKSAQIPLYTWLPDAMAGPTPVSALIHAATMVTAGIYMLVRLNILFDWVPTTQQLITYTGLATSLLAAFIGLRQNDIKKVLAYSTVSQLGFMFIALGIGAYTTAMFHLITHAFFKALLFLGAGSVIHAMGGEQDIRYMGGLKSKIKATYIVFLIGTLAICGIFPLSGMFSKDEILLNLFEHDKILFVLTLISAGFTTIYMFRLLWVTFFGDFRGTKEQAQHLHESPLSMLIPLFILAFLSVVGGVINLPHYTHGIAQKLHNWLKPLYLIKDIHESSFKTEMFVTGITLLMVISIIIATYYIYVKNKKIVQPVTKLSGWEKYAAQKMYIDELYHKLFIKPSIYLSKGLAKFNNNVLDGFVNRVGSGSNYLGQFLAGTQNGNLAIYVFAMVLGAILILVMNFLI